MGFCSGALPMEALFELPARAEAEWGLRRACRLALLRDRLSARDMAGAWGTAFAPPGWLEALSVADMLRHATPFFWLNVGRCLEACANGGTGLAAALRFLLMTGFDAYFPAAPDGFSCRLPAGDGPAILLPRLGVRLAGSGGPARLCRLSRKVLCVEYDGGQTTTVPLDDVPAGARLAWLPVGHPDSARLLLCYHPALCPHAWAADVPADPNDAAGLATMIAAALDLIREVDSRRGEQIAASIRWYLPLACADPSAHRSRTVDSMRGVVFLSPSRDKTVLAEAIVHEYYHSVLHARMEVEPLLAGGARGRFYSPWREDPRPLPGLLHALYVFAGLAEFFRRAEETPSLAGQGLSLRERRRGIVAQLRLGHAQAPVERFTPPGRKLLDGLAAIIDSHQSELGLSSDTPPDALVAHLRRWCAANPGLSAGVRWPFAPARNGGPGPGSLPWENA